MSKAVGPLPQTMPVSPGPSDSTFVPSQIVPFPTALHVCHGGGGGLSGCVTGWPATPAETGMRAPAAQTLTRKRNGRTAVLLSVDVIPAVWHARMRGSAKRSLRRADQMQFRILGPLEVTDDG